MKENDWQVKSTSFAETVRLVENYVKQEIAQETTDKKLYYHTIDHSLAVKRRAKLIFKAIEPVLAQNQSSVELNRLEHLIDVCAIAHDMVQQFSDDTEAHRPRQRPSGISETATVDKLFRYIEKLNQALSGSNTDLSILFSDRDLDVIKDGILATVCDRDPQSGKASYSFSLHSIYQPYLYNSPSEISTVGNIIALADLGTLGMDGVESFVREGILVFLEDNLDLQDLILNNPDLDLPTQAKIKTRLLKMSRFIVSLAQERYARFELEIAGFPPQARQILRDRVFIYFDCESIDKIKLIVPTDEETSFEELISFFGLNRNNKSV